MTVQVKGIILQEVAKVEGSVVYARFPIDSPYRRAVDPEGHYTWEQDIQAAPVQPAVDALPGITNIIVVASGKGGVGKSKIAGDLARTLVRQGARVGLLDGDIHGPNVGMVMGAPQAHTAHNEHYQPAITDGVKWFSMAGLVDDDTAMIWRGPMVGNTLWQLMQKTQWGDLDYLIVDCPPGTGDVYLTLAQKAPISGVLLVTTPDEMACYDTRRCYQMLERLQLHCLGWVMNMAGMAYKDKVLPMFTRTGTLDLGPPLAEFLFDPTGRTHKNALEWLASYVALDIALRSDL